MAPPLLTTTPVMHQRTIRKPVTLEGVGLHSGKLARISITPAPANPGITFRTNEHDEPVPATVESVVNSHYATTVGRNGTRIQTVEHLMAAAAGLGLDNLSIDVDGPEIPAVDGSAKPFVTLLMHAGRTEQSAPRRPLVIPYPISAGSGGRWIQIVPSDVFRISYTLDNDHPAIVAHVIARNAGHALNFDLVVSIQRALGFERRAVGVAVAEPAPFAGRLVPAPAGI